ncbi:ABC transporter substrate-binding protein [Plesiomonas sp.]|uniref:ABC transporter substrate-binding protein n=1 Tax=Plesiomonas sp. TaxID=2486279 RepID=UPI003F343947
MRNTLLLATALSVFTLTGCDNASSTIDAVDASSAAQQSSATPATRSVKHAMGTTEVSTHPVRVVTLTNEATEAMLAMGITPVGAVRSMTVSGQDNGVWYSHFGKTLHDAGTTDLGEEEQVNLEAIAALKPDLILGIKQRQENIYDHLSAIAPTVFSETFMGAWRDNLLTYANGANQQEAAAARLAVWDAKAKQLTNDLQAAGKLQQQVAVVRFQSAGARYYYNDSFATDIIRRVGLARPPLHDKDGFAEGLTRERIPEINADQLFYFVMETGNGKASAAESSWIAEPLWQQLPVVKNGAVHKVNHETWNKSYGIMAADYVLNDLRNALLLANTLPTSTVQEQQG